MELMQEARMAECALGCDGIGMTVQRKFSIRTD